LKGFKGVLLICHETLPRLGTLLFMYKI
jgi:hypothetical protein